MLQSLNWSPALEGNQELAATIRSLLFVTFLHSMLYPANFSTQIYCTLQAIYSISILRVWESSNNTSVKVEMPSQYSAVGLYKRQYD